MIRRFIAHKIIDGAADFIERIVDHAAEKSGKLDKESEEYKNFQASMQEFRDTLKGKKR